MTGVTKITIRENADDLKSIMNQQTSAAIKDKIQVLYLLKTGQCHSVSTLAELLARNRSTIHRWLAQYSDRGITSLLAPAKSNPGRKSKIPCWIIDELEVFLSQSQTLDSYSEVRHWLKQEYQIDVSYHVVRKFICDRPHLKSLLSSVARKN